MPQQTQNNGPMITWRPDQHYRASVDLLEAANALDETFDPSRMTDAQAEQARESIRLLYLRSQIHAQLAAVDPEVSRRAQSNYKPTTLPPIDPASLPSKNQRG